ncbi:amino acid adenylation domain-containing protein [Actinokineospora enzanensis]|uniref:amino acid adenylation domain-containing protein n=1 Tax=Actinokineospora enzanensis TaxID=155975 RepID=UPI00036CF6C0|nr:amino acid adenylation domain-containing protein [Actinokineospora enzanensis]
MPPPRTVAGQASSPGGTLTARFAAAVAAHPDRIAVTDPGGEVTYRELDARADAVAAALRRTGVGRDTAVPLLAEAGIDLVVGIIGVLKSGAAYLPVEPTTPIERMRWLIKDSGAPVVLATCATAGRLDADQVRVLIDDPGQGPEVPARQARGGDLAYVIHTSGSTGQPNGVRVEHRSVTGLFDRTAGPFRFSERDVWTLFHSATFDFSVWEIFGALLHGGRLVVVPEEVSRAPALFAALVAEERVTVLNQTPSAFRRFATAAAVPLPALRLVVLGGERLDVGMLAPWFERFGDADPFVVNMFGITEVTVHASARRITRADLATPTLSPIGVPLPVARFHVLDDNGDPADEGELYISGPCLARDYHNRQALTAQRFIRLPTGERAYRTGDRVRRLPDREYAYLGRLDDQLTVRGFRVEPAEVESILAAHPGVMAGLVTTRDHGDGDIRLIAYLVPFPETPTDAVRWHRLRREIAERVEAALPRHLHPAEYVPIEALPLTRNGKLDRHDPTTPVPARRP